MNPILLGILCFVAGSIVTALALLFIMGASKTNREHEIYMEGFNAGWFTCCDKLDSYSFIEDDDLLNSIKYRMRKEATDNGGC